MPWVDLAPASAVILCIDVVYFVMYEQPEYVHLVVACTDYTPAIPRTPPIYLAPPRPRF